MALKKKTLLKFIHIFCDTLVIQASEIIKARSINIPNKASKYDDNSFSIQIYARKIDALTARKLPSLRVKMITTYTLVLWVPKIPKTFKIDISVKSKGVVLRIKPSMDPGRYRIAYTYHAGNEIRTDQLSPPKSTLVNINYLDLINKDGSIQDQGYQNKWVTMQDQIYKRVFADSL